MANAVYNTFMPVYIKQQGFTSTVTGALLALGTLVAIFAQLFWGLASDRARSKNNVLKILVIASAVIIIIYPASNNIVFLCIVISAFTFFQSSVNPISDAIALEYLESTNLRFGRIRLAGSLGFGFMSVLAGVIINKNTGNMFVLYFIVTLLVLFTVTRMPDIKGHQSIGNKVPMWHLFKNRQLMILIAFNFVVQATMGYYYSFYPIYIRQSGGNNSMLGIAMLISSFSEIPFLLYADKVVERFGIRAVLIFSSLAVTLRWFLMYLITGVHGLLAVNALHGFTFIIFAYCLATYINNNVQKELRASGQTLNGLLCLGLARIIGSSVGGVLVDISSIRVVFLYTAIINTVVTIAFCLVFISQRRSQHLKDIPMK
jgi:Nucleoside H+ symporter.